jgi:alpha-galactosidase
MNKIIIILSTFLLLTQTLDNGVGLTPPMGWNSWNHFGCNIT